MTPSRIPQIIAHQRSIHRSLLPVGVALAGATVLLVVLALRA